MRWSISEMVNTGAFHTIAIMFSTPENLLCKDFLSSGNERKPLCKEMCFEKMLRGFSETVNARAFKLFPLLSPSQKTYL